MPQAQNSHKHTATGFYPPKSFSKVQPQTTYNSDTSTPQHNDSKVKLKLNKLFPLSPKNKPSNFLRIEDSQDRAFESELDSDFDAAVKKTVEMEYQSPEQGLEQCSSMGAFQVLDLSAIQKKEESRNRRKVVAKLLSKTCIGANKEWNYTIKPAEVKKNPGLRKCASLNSRVGLRLKSKTVIGVVTAKNHKKAVKREGIVIRKSKMRPSSTMQKKKETVPVPVVVVPSPLQTLSPFLYLAPAELAVKLRADLYSRTKVREPLSQIKYNFRYQNEETFESESADFLQTSDGGISRSQRQNFLGPHSTGVYLLLKPVHVESRRNYLSFCCGLQQNKTGFPIWGEEEDARDVENTDRCGKGKEALDESYEKSARKKMTEDAKQAWYYFSPETKRASVSETRHLCKDLLKRGMELTDRKPKRRRLSQGNVMIKLRNKEGRLGHDNDNGNLVELSDQEGCRDEEPRMGTPAEALSYKQELKTRTNEILRDSTPLDLETIMKRAGQGSSLDAILYTEKLVPKIRTRFSKRSVENNILQAQLDPTPTEEADCKRTLVVEKVLLSPRTDPDTKLVVLLNKDLFAPQDPELNMGEEKTRSQHEQQKIDFTFRTILLASLDSYAQLMVSKEYTREQELTQTRLAHIEEAIGLIHEDTLPPKCAESVLENEMIAAPFILNGWGGSQANVLKRSYSVKEEELAETPKESRPSIFVSGKW